MPTGLITGVAAGSATIHAKHRTSGALVDIACAVTAASGSASMGTAPSPSGTMLMTSTDGSLSSMVSGTLAQASYFNDNLLGVFRPLANFDGSGRPALAGDAQAWKTTTLSAGIPIGATSFTLADVTGVDTSDAANGQNFQFGVTGGDNNETAVNWTRSGNVITVTTWHNPDTGNTASSRAAHASGVIVGVREDAGDGSGSRSITNVTELYARLRFHPSRTTQDTAGLGSVGACQYTVPAFGYGAKRIFFNRADGTNNGRIYMMFTNAAIAFNCDHFDISVGANTGTNPNPDTFAGSDHEIVIHLKASTGTAGTVGNADGVLECWVDGVKTHNYPAIAICPEAVASFQFNGTWNSPQVATTTYDYGWDVWTP